MDSRRLPYLSAAASAVVRSSDVMLPDGAVQLSVAQAAYERAQTAFATAGYPPLTTQLIDFSRFYPAENAHQQFLAKNPEGHCPVNATGVSCRAG